MKVRFGWAAGAVFAVLGGVTYLYLVNGHAATPTITTTTVTRGDVIKTVEATGTLQALTTVQVGTQVSGTIKALHADFNDNVRRGQVIAELEPSLFEAQLEQARASIVRLQAEARRARVEHDDAQQKYRRATELFERRLVPANDLETAQANARQAEAAVEAADAQIVQARASLHQSAVALAHSTITAPIDGIVISRNVDVGQTVAASMQAPTLFVLARDLTKMQVNASVAESDIGGVAQGQPAVFRVDAYPDVTFHGTVALVRLDPVVAQNVVSYITTINVPNPERLLKPGMTATVTIEIERASHVLRVPNAALRIRPSEHVLASLGGPPPERLGADASQRGRAAARPADALTSARQAEIWVLHDGRLEPRHVWTGTVDSTHAAIVGGELREREAVVTGISTGASATDTTQTTSPLLPRRPSAPRSSGRAS